MSYSSNGYYKSRQTDESTLSVIKRPWSQQEDETLVRLVETFGTKWTLVAQHLNTGRSGKQCRERWHNQLHPSIKKDPWSAEEDRVLIELHRKMGNQWSEIAKYLPGRTANTIKNHWNSTLYRQLQSRNPELVGDVHLPPSKRQRTTRRSASSKEDTDYVPTGGSTHSYLPSRYEPMIEPQPPQPPPQLLPPQPQQPVQITVDISSFPQHILDALMNGTAVIQRNGEKIILACSVMPDSVASNGAPAPTSDQHFVYQLPQNSDGEMDGEDDEAMDRVYGSASDVVYHPYATRPAPLHLPGGGNAINSATSSSGDQKPDTVLKSASEVSLLASGDGTGSSLHTPSSVPSLITPKREQEVDGGYMYGLPNGLMDMNRQSFHVEPLSPFKAYSPASSSSSFLDDILVSPGQPSRRNGSAPSSNQNTPSHFFGNSVPFSFGGVPSFPPSIAHGLFPPISENGLPNLTLSMRGSSKDPSAVSSNTSDTDGDDLGGVSLSESRRGSMSIEIPPDDQGLVSPSSSNQPSPSLFLRFDEYTSPMHLDKALKTPTIGGGLDLTVTGTAIKLSTPQNNSVSTTMPPPPPIFPALPQPPKS